MKKSEDQKARELAAFLAELRDRGFWGKVELNYSAGCLRKVSTHETHLADDPAQWRPPGE
jgi:hypothetical protein